MKSKVNDYKAFTLTFTGRVNSIVSQIGVSLPQIPHTPPNPIADTTALWDTGASNSVLTKSVARFMGLHPIDRVPVQHAGGSTFENVYLVDIHLPNQITIPSVRVTECADNQGHFGIIVGMDIIGNGDFSITNFGGITVFTFRLPSVQSIDFVKDYAEYDSKKLIDKSNSPFIKKQAPVVKAQKPERNDPCHCGSGKKYKYCHGPLEN